MNNSDNDKNDNNGSKNIENEKNAQNYEDIPLQQWKIKYIIFKKKKYQIKII